MIVANILQPLIDAADCGDHVLPRRRRAQLGLSIVALTFATRLLILPLSVSQIRSMRALQALAPQIKAIQERYKDDKQRQQREMIAFYQENKINPFASCIPLLLQLPVFLALYQLLNGQLQGRDDRRAAGRLLLHQRPDEKATGGALVALIILFIVTQLGASAVMAARAEGTSAYHVRPAVRLRPVRDHFPAGLAVYWISTNIWTLGQQSVVKFSSRRRDPDGRGGQGRDAAAASAAKKKKRR